MIERQAQRQARKRGAYALPLWAWPTALSLDAPFVALVWQALFATAYGVTLDWYYPAVLGSSVWLIYAGDRLLDSLSLDLGKQHTYRHALYAHYRRPLLLVWLPTFTLTAVLAFTVLPYHALRLGSGLGCAVGLYMLGTHFFKTLSLSKEALIGLVFAVAVSLPLWDAQANANLGLATLLLAVLASLNCLLIAFWECEVDRAQNQLSSLRTAPRLARVIAPLLVGLGLFSVAAGFVLPPSIALSVATSALLMLALKTQRSLDGELRRVLADVALLTPLIFFAFS